MQAAVKPTHVRNWGACITRPAPKINPAIYDFEPPSPNANINQCRPR